MSIVLTEEGKKILADVKTVVVTGKANGDTVYFGHREIVLKMSVGRAVYKTLKEGDQLHVINGKLAFGEMLEPKESKSNPPLSQFKHRFPQ